MSPNRSAACLWTLMLLAAPQPPARGGAPQGDSTVRLEVVRDTWVSAYPGEEEGNLGGEPRLKLKGTQELAILDVDTAPLRGKLVAGAALFLRSRSQDPVRRATVSSLAADWGEGTGRAYGVQPGSASFLWARQGESSWAFAGSDITAVINGAGNTVWSFADATPLDDDGWQRLEVDPRVLAARVAGISYGLVLLDDVGSEYRRRGEEFVYLPFRNRFVASREAGAGSAPYLMVRLGGDDRLAPGAVSGLAQEPAVLPPGQAVLGWRIPADAGGSGVIGFFARWSEERDLDWEGAHPVPRYLIPMARDGAGPVRMVVRDLGIEVDRQITMAVRAVDGAGNLGPVTTTAVRLAPPLAPELPAREGPEPFAARAPLPVLDGLEIAFVDPLDKIRPDSCGPLSDRPSGYLAGNHLWSAERRLLRLQAARNEHVMAQLVLIGGPTPTVEAEAQFEGGSPAPVPRWFRFERVATPAGPLPDPLMPLSDPPRLGPGGGGPPDARCASFLLEFYVPGDVQPGVRRGRILLRGAQGSVAIEVEMRIWSFRLPDRLSFIPQMNTYRLPGPPAELAYYRLAHEHRACLNRLPYNWRGELPRGLAPRPGAAGWSWKEFDRRVGPLLDGSAFADLPRGAVPVEAFYLPLNENWPASIDSGFTGGYWAEEALSDDYREEFMRGARRFAEHIRQRGWNRTAFEFYLNNKLSYKRSRGGWSGSSAPWIFDEPANTQDFWALRWYATAFHQAVDGVRGDARVVFRADVSRPQWQRDILDGVLDVNVVAARAVDRYCRQILERKSRWGEITYAYGEANRVDQPNTEPVVWSLGAWLLGLDGVIPWQTVGRAAAWQRGEATALFYPGRPVASPSPLPSIRLKAFRRGQQDVEYLVLYSDVVGSPRWEIVRLVRGWLGIAEGADCEPLGGAQPSPEQLWRLRTGIGAILDRAAPNGHGDG